MASYPYVDLSRMLMLPKCAVICRTEEEIKHFHHNCANQLGPDFYEWSLDTMMKIWRRNYTSNERGFSLFYQGVIPAHMSWCSERWFEDNGYEVVNFSDLTNSPVIAESDIDLSVLLGLNGQS